MSFQCLLEPILSHSDPKISHFPHYLQIPTEDASGSEIPLWKREMMAKKAADKAKESALRERIEMEEAKKVDAMPEWKRHLLEKRAMAEKADEKR